MTDLSLISRPQPVLIHPLLQTLPYTKIGTNGENPQLKGGEEKDIESPQQFLDPLGAADGGTHQGSDYGTTDGKRFVQTSSTPVLGEAETGPLDNTLVQNDNEDWPLYELDSSEPQLVSFRPWREFRQLILNKFTTGETLDLQSSFLTKTKVVSQNGTNSNKKQQQLQQRHRISAAVAKEKKRQDYGNAPSSAQPTTFHDLCPEEWLHKLAELRKQLQLQWREERRLDCIKLISELLSQLSGNICSAQFYPAQFVHITDLLDYFGWLVWQRLFQLAQEERRKAQLGPLPSQWTINDVLGETRLKARNWFGKINQSVLNLTPRLYMLAAVLPCQRFMDPWPEAAQENMLELCRAARQIQHPLVSSYLRCYLCRVAMRVQPADRAPHWKCLNDWLQTYTQQPISLLWPAMEWIVQCVAYTACTYEDLHPMWEYCRRVDKRPMILVPMLNALPRLYLGEHALEACRIITSSELVTGDELCAFGRNLLEAQIPQPAHKPILRSVWKCILRLGSLKEYLACCECWCQFIVRHFTANEVHVVLENIMRKLQNDKCELFHHQLLAVLSKIFAQAREVRSLLGMEIFAKFFDIFRSAASPIRVEASKDVLSPLVAKHGVGTFTEIVSAYQILSVCQLLHDSTELSAPCDQMAGAIRLTSAALDRINLHSSPDQCLAFLVSCRAGLSNWDALQRYVIRRVQAFTLDITRSIRYTSSRAAFLQGCMANLFISIPSLSDPLDRIELAIQSAQIALAAMAFLHVDSFVGFTLDQFAEFTTKSLPNNFGPRLFRIGEYFLATLANIPQFNFSVDDVEDAQRQPGGEQQSMRHFQRFLDSVLSLQLSQSAQPNNDKLVQLFIRCLQYIFVLRSNQAQKKQSSTGISNDLDVQTNCWAFPPGNHFASNEDKTGHQLMEENSICLDLIEKITEAIEPPLLLGESESDEFCAIGMELLELVSQFGGDDLPTRLRALVKAVYKRCRRRPALARRVNRLKKRGTTEAESNRNAL